MLDFSNLSAVAQMLGAGPGIHDATIARAATRRTRDGASVIVLSWAHTGALDQPVIEEVLAIGGTASSVWRAASLQRVYDLLDLSGRRGTFATIDALAQALVGVRARLTVSETEGADGVKRRVVSKVEAPADADLNDDLPF